MSRRGAVPLLELLHTSFCVELLLSYFGMVHKEVCSPRLSNADGSGMFADTTCWDIILTWCVFVLNFSESYCCSIGFSDGRSNTTGNECNTVFRDAVCFKGVVFWR